MDAVRLIKIVLDVLKPREIPVYHLATSLAELENVQQVTVDVIEVDVKTETVSARALRDRLEPFFLNLLEKVRYFKPPQRNA
jgi:hypothetical protein